MLILFKSKSSLQISFFCLHEKLAQKILHESLENFGNNFSFFLQNVHRNTLTFHAICPYVLRKTKTKLTYNQSWKFQITLTNKKNIFFLSKKSLLCRLIFNRKKEEEIINDSYFKRISYYRLMFVDSMKIIQVKLILIQHILFCKMWVQLEQNIFDIISLLFLLYH